jgi:SAM-dependent methyltransferase
MRHGYDDRMRRRSAQPMTYSERTTASPFWIVRFAHRRRYELIISAALEGSPGVLLDYGAGEGDMLMAMLAHEGCLPSLRVIAYEPSADSLRKHLANRSGQGRVDRIEVAERLEDVPDQSCDALTCAGVLEHLILADRFEFYSFARRVLRPGGRIVVDVPVEIGPTILVKNLGRRWLKGDRREYSLLQSVSAAVGRTIFDPVRFDPDAGAQYILTHKGFDHRIFLRELEGQGFQVDDVVSSPLPWLPPALGSQEVIVVGSVRPSKARVT